MILSIIIPAYNAEQYLRECLDSCLNQDIPKDEYEIIVVNDGSADATLEVAGKWASRYSNIKVFTQENQGPSIARNKAIDAAQGELIMFIDSDDYIVENCLRALTDRCLDENLDMLRFCAANMIDGKAVRRIQYGTTGITPGKELLKTSFQVCAPFSVYRKAFLNEAGLRFHPGILHEDNEFTPRAYYKAARVGSSNDIIYFVRQTPGSITRSANPKKSYDHLTVVGQLDRFASEHADKEYRPYFDKQIADCLNSCFNNMCRLKDEDRRKLEAVIYENRHILRHFLNSSALTHRIEGMLLNAFPRHILGIYKALNIIHR